MKVEKVKVRSRDNHVMLSAGLLGAGLFMFVQFAFGMLPDVMSWNVAEAAEQCRVLYMTGNAPMYSCGPAP